MIPRIEILPAAQEQLSQIAEIAGQSFSDPWSAALFAAAWEQPDTRILVAMAGETVAGYLVLQRLGEEQSVDDIAVAPAFRRQGIARQLLETAHGQFPECAFLLEVREHNTAAIALYEKLGYERVGMRKRYYTNPTEAALLYTRFV